MSGRRARRAYVRIEYDGKDITDQLSEMLISVSYTDNTDEADNLEITLEDREGNWAGSWFPKVAIRAE